MQDAYGLWDRSTKTLRAQLGHGQFIHVAYYPHSCGSVQLALVEEEKASTLVS